MLTLTVSEHTQATQYQLARHQRQYWQRTKIAGRAGNDGMNVIPDLIGDLDEKQITDI
jgi:hypothetical protein